MLASLTVILNQTIHRTQRVSKHVHVPLLAMTALLVALATAPPRAVAGDFSTLQWANQAIHLPQAWQVVPGRGAGITICDADSGVMLNHPDLKGAITGGINTASATTPESYGDDDGHGTWTAGIMVARGNDVWGVAPGASLFVAKVLGAGSGDQMSVTSGILWCVDHGARVVNISLGSPATLWDGFAEAIGYGCAHGVDFAVAAGNERTVAEPINPAKISSPCLITANASNQHDQLTYFSNLLENPRTVTAPGQVIVSDWTNGSVTLGSGTSASAPFVAGVMALLRSQGADAQTAVKVILQSARHPKGVNFTHGRNRELGYGVLDAGAACMMYQTLENVTKSVLQSHFGLIPGAD
jgi:subtilisin family serine protease